MLQHKSETRIPLSLVMASAFTVFATTLMLGRVSERLFFNNTGRHVHPVGLLYIGVIALFTVLGGRRCGVFTLILTLVGALFLLPPRGAPTIGDGLGALEIILLVLLGIMAIAAGTNWPWMTQSRWLFSASNARPAGTATRLLYAVEEGASPVRSAVDEIDDRSPQPRRRKMKVLIQGAYGNGNSGDDAILLSLLDTLESMDSDLSVTVLSDNEAQTEQLLSHRAKACPGRLRSLRHVWNNIRLALDCDLYLFGGGGIMGNMVTTMMFGLLVRATLCRLAGHRAMVYAVGSDPISRPFTCWIAQRIAGMVEIMTVRDEQSRSYLLAAGVPPGKVVATADPAFCLTSASSHQIHLHREREGITRDGRPVVGIALVHELTEAQKDIFAGAADALTDQLNCRVVFVPFERHNDLPACRAVAQRMRHQPTVIEGVYTPGEIKGLIGSLDLLVGMRYHSLLFAVACAVPVVAVSFVPKSASLMRAVGRESDIVYCGWMAQQRKESDFTGEQLVQHVLSVWADHDTIRRSLAARSLEMKEQSERNAQIAISLLDRKPGSRRGV